MSPFIDDHRAAREELCRRHGVRRLFLFGSAARDDFDPARSDEDAALCRVSRRPSCTTCARRRR